VVLATSSRLLGLLSLLQTRRDWPGAELADRLDVSARTIRRDVDRLRELGYPVRATQGSAGYRLGAGARMPPLLLDDEEAVAVAVGLRTAAGGTVAGIEETSVRALAKLEQVLPAHVRRRIQALHAFTVPFVGAGPTADPEVIAVIASACRDHERLRLTYRSRDGREGRRLVEPHRLVHTGRRWYLLAWDAGRQDWRTFRVDRIDGRPPSDRRFEPRPLPDEDIAAYVARAVTRARDRQGARVRFDIPLTALAARIPPSIGTLEALDEYSCALHTDADAPGSLIYIAMLGLDFTVLEPPELRQRLQELAGRLARGAS